MSSGHSSPSCASESVPSFVDYLNLDVISSLATQTRSGEIKCTVDPTPKIGAFNAVYFLEFTDGVRWVARIPIPPWSEALQKRMSLDRISLDFIGNNTTIPVPRIIDCQTTENNALGRPYTFTTFLPGTQLAKLWFDSVWFTDEHRNTVFESLARLMSQLSSHEFPMIGQLDIDPTTGAVVVGPYYPSLGAISEGEMSPDPVGDRSPSTYIFLQRKISDQLKEASDTRVISDLQLLRTFASMLPNAEFDGAPFFLAHPDFGYQNILVDEEGNVTGIVDWDGVRVVPRQYAFARYPSWITRDWDPLLYGYCEASAAQEEDSPETLSRFREEYLAVFNRLNPAHAQLTRHSHILEALIIAITASYTRSPILDKLMEHVYGGNDDVNVKFLSFDMLARRLSTSAWTRDTVGAEKLARGGDYI
ncbi:kinase-like domain-containing protein [Mycena metata]|uniref:Kinase-like domain-containing protein n=1 Tax=Mycena metata TaxID=1033252 RepID=A0AAD7NCC3_9AGAR|nr:kinase-like domain-containing protein [Mycena metata]